MSKRLTWCAFLMMGVLALAACGDDDGGDDGDDSATADAAPGTPDAAGQDFPAVCDNMALLCPDAASLAACEAGSAGFGPCEYLPITEGCAGGVCPSEAQICRTAELEAGYCTHTCSNDDDCPLPEGGTATCTDLGGVNLCIL